MGSSLYFSFSVLDPFQDTLYSPIKVGVKSRDPQSSFFITSSGENIFLGGGSNWLWELGELEGTTSLKEIDVFGEVEGLEEECEVVEQEDLDFNGYWGFQTNKVYAILL